MGSLRSDVLQYAKTEYNTTSEHLWRAYPSYEVLRHEPEQPSGRSSKVRPGKWYGIIMNVKRSTLGLPEQGLVEESDENLSDWSGPEESVVSEGDIADFGIMGGVIFEPTDDYVDILNVKLDPMMVDMLECQPGFLPAYHMSKKGWLSVLLDGSVEMAQITNLLDQSYAITAGKKSQKKVRTGPRDWLIPSNPKYYDVVAAFEAEKIIDWKQSSDVRVGDLIYMYVGAPYSAILYKCRAVEVDIPYPYEHHLNIKRLMKIELLNKYDPDFMTLERLKREYGVYAVRGPRGVPNSLKYDLDIYEK